MWDSGPASVLRTRRLLCNGAPTGMPSASATAGGADTSALSSTRTEVRRPMLTMFSSSPVRCAFCCGLGLGWPAGAAGARKGQVPSPGRRDTSPSATSISIALRMVMRATSNCPASACSPGTPSWSKRPSCNCSRRMR
ncbi:hypothetical protein D9M68_564220 [compost metagenome]